MNNSIFDRECLYEANLIARGLVAGRPNQPSNHDR